MAQEKPVRCEFLIPLVRDGDRKPHQPWAWAALDDALYSCFDGLTGPKAVYRVAKPVRGQYRSEKKGRVQDECRHYWVCLPRRRIDLLRAVLRRAANTFDQESIFFDVRGEVEFLVACGEEGLVADWEAAKVSS